MKNDPFVSLPENMKIFEKDFLDHPKSSWLTNTPIFRQTKEYNLNLLGCLFHASQSIMKS